MKTRVVKDDYQEIEIRPKEEFDHFLSLIKRDIKEIFKSRAGNYFYFCPACTNKESDFKFSKNGFVYRECLFCGTVFMTPRPNREMLHDFFANSSGLKYWNSKAFQGSESRKEHVLDPRMRWITESLDFADDSSRTYLDFYSKYLPFVTKISSLKNLNKKVSYKPIEGTAKEIKDLGFEIIDSLGEEKYSVVTAFEVFDRFYNPRKVLETIKKNMETGGLLFLSTTSASGLDFQFLLKKSKNIVPPLHMNIFSVEGMIKILEDFDFEVVELSTPGSLDIKILEEQIDEISAPKFLTDLIQNRDNYTKEAFQEFLQRARLSSHMRVLAKNK
ncbi:MAG: class I SAM-dependent methyltransferase [Ignavibacteriaceae bacterium]|nr:class I SAM-dependent methyltransferase [Ignavibacteriaceae bacterium]